MTYSEREREFTGVSVSPRRARDPPATQKSAKCFYRTDFIDVNKFKEVKTE